MVDIQDLLYWGSVMITLNKKGNLVGSALVELENGYFPLTLSDEDLSFIKLEKGIMGKLQKGNVLYMVAGNVYLGKPYLDGPYGEEKKFISEVDAEALTLSGMLQNLEYRIGRNLGKKKTLIKIGEFYKPNA